MSESDGKRMRERERYLTCIYLSQSGEPPSLTVSTKRLVEGRSHVTKILIKKRNPGVWFSLVWLGKK